MMDISVSNYNYDLKITRAENVIGETRFRRNIKKFIATTESNHDLTKKLHLSLRYVPHEEFEKFD